MAPELLIVFSLQDQRHAVRLPVVERVLPAAAVTGLPGAPAAVLGALDLGGTLLPVYSLRRRLGLRDRPLQPSDRFLLVCTARRRLLLVADEVHGVSACDAPWSDPACIVPGLQGLGGVARLPDGLVLIHDVEQFLSARDEADLDEALRERT